MPAATGRACGERWNHRACGPRWPGMQLTCPKCHGAMRSYERNGIVIDQCAECRGVFLDRGELEKLIDAESREAATAPAPPRRPGAHPSHARSRGTTTGRPGTSTGTTTRTTTA